MIHYDKTKIAKIHRNKPNSSMAELLCNKIRSTFCTRLKIWIFKDFCVLNTIGTFIFACKLGKTAKNAIEVAKNAILGPFWTPLTQKGGKGGPN